MVALVFWRDDWKKAFLFMVLTMVVDVDHLLAQPIYDPNRCSIGFHPLHQPVMVLVYVLMSCFRKTRYAGAGLLIHMLLDSIDCFVNTGKWMN